MADLCESKQRGFRADSLLTGMAVMLVLTVVQRAVGFGRGVWFCKLLDESVLGQWAMAYGFITLVTPMMLLGLPGSMPRFVEHFRLQGYLSPFLKRLVLATIVCPTLLLLGFAFFPEVAGWLVFAQAQQVALVYAVGVAVATTIAFNFVNDLAASLRLVRVVSWMQFLQSIGFTVFALAWLQGDGGLAGVIHAFAIANLVGMLPGLWAIARGWESKSDAAASFDSLAMWRRLLPYAMAVWAMNLIGNLFEFSDRYILLHLTPGGEEAGQAAVGQYHSARLFPTLFYSVAMMLSGILMPYLTADWEAGRRDRVSSQMRMILLLFSLCFTSGAAFVMLLSPVLFETLLDGRYNDGLTVMPAAFVFTIWATIVLVGQNYLWVLEKGRSVSVALTAGLVANIALNVCLVPMLGLQGAVVATMLSNFVVLLGFWICMHHCGYPVDAVSAICTLLPVCLLIGAWPTLLVCLVVAATSSDLRREYRGLRSGLFTPVGNA